MNYEDLPPATATTATVCRFMCVEQELSKELELLVCEWNVIVGDGGGFSLLLLVVAEARRTSEWLLKSKQESRSADFFKLKKSEKTAYC